MDLLVVLTFRLNRARQMCSLGADSDWHIVSKRSPLTLTDHTHFVDFCPDRNPHRFLRTAARTSKIEGLFEEPTHCTYLRFNSSTFTF